MFWQSVIEGIGALFDWHIIVGAIAVAGISYAVPILSGLMIGNNESGARAGAGCIMMLIGGPIAQACAVTLFVLFCFPSIVGSGGFTPIAIAGALWWPVLKYGLLAMIFVLLLSVIPLLGHFIASTPGVPLFLQGIFVIKPFTELLFAVTGNQIPDSVFPGFWLCVGYAVIGTIICYGAIFAAAWIGTKKDSSEPSGFPMLIGLVLGAISGLIPLLMYGRYIATSLRG
jgi:hypothetical protein